jgi:AcrR family transcriptional regulator
VTTPIRRPRHVQAPRRGDERRRLLLTALEDLLATTPFAEIGISDITAAAGVTRSGFYFYFSSKAAAVAALLEDFREQMEEAGAAWYESSTASPLDRVTTTVHASAALWRSHAHLLVAMLDAASADPEAREIWGSWTAGFVERISARIRADRKAGLVHTTADAGALAVVLMGATLRAMEAEVRQVAAGRRPTRALNDALIDLWFRTLYAA